MSRPRYRYLKAGLAFTTAILLAVIYDWGQLSAVIAALPPAEALLGILGVVLTAMTGTAGVLIAADARADMAAAQARDEIHAEAVAIATPAETAPKDTGDALYMAVPQDEGLRRILLAHRYTVPMPPPNGIGSLAPERDDAHAVPAGTSEEPEHHVVRTFPVVEKLGAQLKALDSAQRELGPRLISSNAKSALGRTLNDAVRNTLAPKRIANARWDWSAFATAASTRLQVSDFAYSEIVLADPNGRGENSAPSNVATQPETTVQPCCRGPPRATCRRHVTDGRKYLGKPFREIEGSRAIPPADLVVLDNLGDRVPICEAELDVLEAFLDDVLRDVLGSADTAPKPT